MSSSNLIRWSGLAPLIGGVLFIVLSVAESILFGNQTTAEAAATSVWIFVKVDYFVMTLLIILGLVGLYTRQVEQAGSLGLIAFILAFSGTVMVSASIWGEAFIGTWLAEVAPELLDTDPSGAIAASVILSFGLFTLGWFLFGLATLRARVLPGGAALLLMIGSVLFLILGFLSIPFVEGIVFGAAVAWMGYALWSGTDESNLIVEAAR